MTRPFRIRIDMQAHDRDAITPAESPSSAAVTRPWRTASSTRTAVTILITVLVFIVAFFHYRSDVGTTDFHPDESRWLNRAHYLEGLLDPFGRTWEDQYLTRGQPPVGSYVMGAGLLLQGQDLDTNHAWDFRRAGSWNVDNGMYPTPKDLRAGRMTNVTLGAAAVSLTFLAVTLLSNPAGGLVAAAILTFHPLQSWHNRLALADTTLTLTLAAVVLAVILLLRHPTWFRAIAVGVLTGLGGANKLTPMALAFVLAGVGAVLLVLAWRNNRRAPLSNEPWFAAIPGAWHVGWMLISTPVVAGITFVAVYPYLWKAPIERTLLLLDFRQNEMEAQARLFPQFAVETTGEAVRRTWTSLAGRWSATEWMLDRIGLSNLARWLSPLDLLLAIVGVGVLGWVALRMPARSGHLVVLLILVVQTATVVLAMRTDFERYYLPIVLSAAMLAGAGGGLLSETLWRLAERDQRAPRREPVRRIARSEGSQP